MVKAGYKTDITGLFIIVGLISGRLLFEGLMIKRATLAESKIKSPWDAAKLWESRNLYFWPGGFLEIAAAHERSFKYAG